MREILFRGKRLDNGEWIKGNIHKNVYDCDERSGEVVANYFIYPLVCASMEKDCYEVDPETVGQYTGLTDMNGKKIFEGDIVRLREQKNKKPVIGEIKYKGHGFYLIKNNNGHLFANGLYGISEVEVIGNIHDNKELLKVE